VPLFLFKFACPMEKSEIIKTIARLGCEYDTVSHFIGKDPIIFPRHFYLLFKGLQPEENFPVPDGYKVQLQDIEIAGIIAAHLAWGRRAMILRDTGRAMDEMHWKPYEYVMAGKYRNEDKSLHRTVKWSEFAMICGNLRKYYTEHQTLEPLTPDQMRVYIFGQKSDLKMPNKKIHMFRRWMVRNDGLVDFGLWKTISPADLIIPLDVHVHDTALDLGITDRKPSDYRTAKEITDFCAQAFPGDPCKGDYALFAYSVENPKPKKPKATKQKDC
jgi:hypothetical protein